MKKTIKAIFCVALVVAFVFVLTGCEKLNYIANSAITAIKEVQDGTWNQTDEETDDSSSDSTIEAFVAGTYGGIDFETEEDVVNYYVECYNNTKSQTANYIDADGNTVVFYSLLGEEELTVGTVLVEGSENSVINALVPTIVSSLYSANVYGLPPCNNRNPLLDNSNQSETDPGEYDFTTSYFTADDCEACNVTDNGDGTITIVIQPKSASMSAKGEDSQGRFFQSVGDIGETVDSMSILSWAEGTTEENCIVTYEGGTGTITIDTSTNTIIEADYHMIVSVSVVHASVSVITDKSASLEITYDMHYPASDEYLLETRGLTRA